MTVFAFRSINLLSVAASFVFMGAASSLAADAPIKEGLYGSISGGFLKPSSSSNGATLTADFTTGMGTTIAQGTVWPDGTKLAWNSQFDNGYHGAVSLGFRYNTGFRTEFEVRYQRFDVQSHDTLLVNETVLSSEDAGLLITGSDALGSTVADFLIDDQGHIGSMAFMGNTYYDFMAGDMFSPYVGFGLGVISSKISYQPSGTLLANDRDLALAFQFIGGGSVTLMPGWSLFADYRYFTASDAKVQMSLLPSTLKVDQKASLVTVGFRVNF